MKEAKSVKEKKIKKNPAGTKIKKEFVFKLTKDDKEKYFDKLGVLREQLNKMMIEFDNVKEAWKAKVNAKADELAVIENIATKGEEIRTLESTMVKDFDQKEIRYYFEGKVIETRAATIDELQMEMKVLKTRDAGKTIANVSGKKAKNTDIADVIRMETGRKTKTNAIDGATRS